MMPMLQLTPAAAARMYEGPRYRRSRSPAETRKFLREQIRKLKASDSLMSRYFGCIAEAIMKIDPRDLVRAAR
ncbi:MAG: hypothetical protein WBN22_01010 [Verrucomicrobiia bacterium]